MTRTVFFRAAASLVIAGSTIALVGQSVSDAASSPHAREHPSHRGASVPSRLHKGGFLYKHKPSFAPPDHDRAGERIPIGPFHARSISPELSFVRPGNGAAEDHAVRPHVSRTVRRTQTAVSTCNPSGCWPPEPNEASDGGASFVYTTNTYVGFSVNGGASFKSFTPGSLYSDDPDGGPCCDQIVQYAPQINRFIWLMQYNANSAGYDRYRLAVFPPSSVTANGLTSWESWDITPQEYPGLSYHWFDFPDLALGSRYLYLSNDEGVASTDKVYGSIITRIGLAELASGANLASGSTAWRFLTGSFLFGRVAQQTGSTAYRQLRQHEPDERERLARVPGRLVRADHGQHRLVAELELHVQDTRW